MSGQFIRKISVILIVLCLLTGHGVLAASLENTSLGAPRGDGAIASTAIGRGLRYLYGSGVERDHVRALMWFKLALATEQPGAAKYYDLIARRMTPLQIARAQALADICSDSNYTECD